MRWTPSDSFATDTRVSHAHRFPVISQSDIFIFDDNLDYWDAWPLLTIDGAIYKTGDGTQFWFALAAEKRMDPLDRHALARIHFLKRKNGKFHPVGPAMPGGHSPGSREWSGSAAIDTETGKVTLYFTAAGRRGEQTITYEQRLFAACAQLSGAGLKNWQPAFELLRADGQTYRVADEGSGEIGTIKAFRDPEHFRDPATGKRYILFTASSALNPGPFDGVIGFAELAHDETASLQSPLVDASGFNNELERPHIRYFDNFYYLFWSTQSHVFSPDAGQMPTGLYGAVAKDIAGPWRLLNGTGLVAANPQTEPVQAYSWLVLPDRSVTSFVDYWGMQGRNPRGPHLMRTQFGGTFAPFCDLHLHETYAAIVNA